MPSQPHHARPSSPTMKCVPFGCGVLAVLLVSACVARAQTSDSSVDLNECGMTKCETQFASQSGSDIIVYNNMIYCLQTTCNQCTSSSCTSNQFCSCYQPSCRPQPRTAYLSCWETNCLQMCNFSSDSSVTVFIVVSVVCSVFIIGTVYLCIRARKRRAMLLLEQQIRLSQMRAGGAGANNQNIPIREIVVPGTPIPQGPMPMYFSNQRPPAQPPNPLEGLAMPNAIGQWQQQQRLQQGMPIGDNAPGALNDKKKSDDDSFQNNQTNQVNTDDTSFRCETNRSQSQLQQLINRHQNDQL